MARLTTFHMLNGALSLCTRWRKCGLNIPSIIPVLALFLARDNIYLHCIVPDLSQSQLQISSFKRLPVIASALLTKIFSQRLRNQSAVTPNRMQRRIPQIYVHYLLPVATSLSNTSSVHSDVSWVYTTSTLLDTMTESRMITTIPSCQSWTLRTIQ